MAGVRQTQLALVLLHALATEAMAAHREVAAVVAAAVLTAALMAGMAAQAGVAKSGSSPTANRRTDPLA